MSFQTQGWWPQLLLCILPSHGCCCQVNVAIGKLPASPAGSSLQSVVCVGDMSGSISIFELGGLLPIRQLRCSSSQIRSIALSPSSGNIAAFSTKVRSLPCESSPDILVWQDLVLFDCNGTLLGRVRRLATRVTCLIFTEGMSWRDETDIVTGHSDGSIKVPFISFFLLFSS